MARTERIDQRPPDGAATEARPPAIPQSQQPRVLRVGGTPPLAQCAASFRAGGRGLPDGAGRARSLARVSQIHSAAALYVRERSGFREARPQEIIQRADALICERFRPGAPVRRGGPHSGACSSGSYSLASG